MSLSNVLKSSTPLFSTPPLQSTASYNPEVNSTVPLTVTKIELELDNRYAPYSRCNINSNNGSYTCEVQSRRRPRRAHFFLFPPLAFPVLCGSPPQRAVSSRRRLFPYTLLSVPRGALPAQRRA